MSRIGKEPIAVPAGVDVSVDGSRVSVKGPRGQLEQSFHPDMRILLEDGTLRVERPSDERDHRCLHGLTRPLIANMVEGVTHGYETRLEVGGVGARAVLRGPDLELALGFSHAVSLPPAAGLQLPRRAVDRSNRHIYAQLVDDVGRRTVASASDLAVAEGDKSARAKEVGKLLADRAKSAGVQRAVFDRGGRLYHGRVRALAEG